MVDLLFGHSYFLRFDPKLWQARQPFPPLGTLYAASYLRSHGFHVSLFDAMLAVDEYEWVNHLKRDKPQIAVIYEDNFNYLSKMCLLRMREAAFTMIEQAKQRNIKVIVAGADATDHSREYLNLGADYVIVGEGEETLLALTQYLVGENSSGLDEIPGLAWLEEGGQGQFRCTPRRQPISDLDSLPFPAWDLVDMDRYREIWIENHGYFALNIVSTRGCPYHCNWCAKPIWGQRYNARTPGNVIAEIKSLIERFAPDYFWFVDDIFGLKPGWIKDFSTQLKEDNIRIKFKCLSRADLLLRSGEIEALKEAGADYVWIGAESGSQKVLDAMDKGIRIGQIETASRQLKSHDIRVGYFLQFGYPGETLEDIKKTFKMVHSYKPDDIGISVSYPLPGTKFFHAVQEQLKGKQNWYDSDDLAMLYQGPFTTEFYRQLHRTLHAEFRFQKALGFLLGKRRESLTHVSFSAIVKGFIRCVFYGIQLPFYRFWLHALARQSHTGIDELPESLTYDQASLPTPQEE